AHIAGEVSRVEGGHSLSARMRWSGQLECSRCLTPYDFANDEQFSLLLYPRKPVHAAEVSLDRDDLDAHYYDDPAVSVAPIVEERIQMAVPMKPLCRPECRGLCPQCGTDLNVSECNCVVDEIDPRWRALELLKKEEEFHAESETTSQQSAAGQAARARCALRTGALRVSELPRAESAAPRVPPARVLPGEAAH